MGLKDFIFSKTFLKNLGLAAVIVVGAIMILPNLAEYLYQAWSGKTGSRFYRSVAGTNQTTCHKKQTKISDS